MNTFLKVCAISIITFIFMCLIVFVVNAGVVKQTNRVNIKVATTNETKQSVWQKLQRIKNKLQKNQNNYDMPIAVAGVRGDDMSSVNKSQINPSDLIWEE